MIQGQLYQWIMALYLQSCGYVCYSCSTAKLKIKYKIKFLSKCNNVIRLTIVSNSK